MVRKLKFHERKLLKKVDYEGWADVTTVGEGGVVRRFHLQDRELYPRYRRLIKCVKVLVEKIKEMDEKDPYRLFYQRNLTRKLYQTGLLKREVFSECENLKVTSICYRHLSNILVRSNMCQSIAVACRMIQHGHVRVGATIVTDPYFVVTRSSEDFVTWANRSAIRRHIALYHDQYDDYEANNE